MSTINSMNSTDTNELILEIPVWVNGKRKWVTGITKKTTFDDLIYALLVQAELLKSSDITNNITGYAISECIQSTPSSTESVITQRILKGRSKVIKAYKSWQFDKLPLTILHLISTSSSSSSSLLIDNNNNNNNNPSSSSTTKFRSKIFRHFLSSKQSTHQKILNNYHENLNILQRQKRLLDYLDDKIHQAEQISSNTSSNLILTLNDVSHILSSKSIEQEQLILATQLCNSIFNIQEHIDEKTNISHAVEQALSNELNHYDTLPINFIDNKNSSNDLITLKNSIYRSRELSRIQSKEMHDLDLSLRETENLLTSKYDEVKCLEYETSSNQMMRTRSLKSNINLIKQINHNEQQITYDTNELILNSMKEIDEDSGINSLTSEDSNHHSISIINQKHNTQLETLV